MENKVDVLVGVCLYSRERRVVTLFATFEYFLYLMPLVAQDNILEVAYKHRVCHNSYLVDMLIALEHVDSVLYHHFACHLKELFRCRHSEA